MTPRQFHWLWDEYRETLLHTELMFGLNTSAVVNHSFNHPEKWISHTEYMPNLRHRETPSKAITEEEKEQRREAMIDFQAQAAQLSLELKEQQFTGRPGVLMLQMGLAKAVED